VAGVVLTNNGPAPRSPRPREPTTGLSRTAGARSSRRGGLTLVDSATPAGHHPAQRKTGTRPADAASRVDASGRAGYSVSGLIGAGSASLAGASTDLSAQPSACC